ncbi:MAG: type IV secretory system conjugative DNA transfer family protein [Magnetospirillum sp.]|nr:type IV secretory system conjugative DNA transfer family protein [Magnetospirillum sp.]
MMIMHDIALAVLWLYLHFQLATAIAAALFVLLVSVIISLPKIDNPATAARMALRLSAGACLAITPGAYFWLPSVIAWLWQDGLLRGHFAPIEPPIVAGGAGILVALGLYWYAFRPAIAKFDAIKQKLALRTTTARATRTDIRTVADSLPAPKSTYDPTKYFRDGQVFLGLDRRGKPVCIPYAVFARCHIQLVGTTGAGKGVAAGLCCGQALKAGEAVVVLDPKDDEWAPSLLGSQAELLGKPFLLIDLRKEVPQINILAGATAEQVEELLVAGFSLSDKGSGADFYRMGDRRAARVLSRQVIVSDRANPATLADLAEAATADPAMAESAAGLIGRLEESAAGGTVCAGPHAPDLADIIAQGGCVYVIGSMRHGRILALQRMLLVRLCQIVESRDRVKGKPRQVLIFLDELKAHISRPALEMLGAIRDKGAHLILAHQSLGDLRDCPADLNPDAVQDAVIENCKIRIAYKIQNADTAEWLARTTGKILVDDESRNFTTSKTGALVETSTGDRSIRQAERDRIDSNHFLALPEKIAAVFAPGLIDFSYICPIPTEKRALAPGLAGAAAPADAEPDEDEGAAWADALAAEIAGPGQRRSQEADDAPDL